MKIKKWSAVFMSTVMTVSLAACGGSSSNKSATTAQPSQSTDASSEQKTEIAEASDTSATNAASTEVPSDYDWPQMEIQVGHTNSSIETDYKQKLATLFGDYVSEESNGAITVTVLGDSQLGKENALTEGLQLGMIDMAVLSSPTFSNYDNMHLFTELPFLFQNVNAGREFVASDEYKEMNESIVDSLGIRFLTTGELGMRYVINNVRPINAVADMKGLKLRTPETDIVLSIFKDLGANPTALAISETLTAIQQGTIDGGEFPTGTIASSGFDEVTRYLSKTNHQYTLCYLAISEQFYQGLDPEVQNLFNEAAAYAQAEQYKFIDQEDAAQMKSFEEAGMQINDISDPQQFKAAVADVYTTYREKIGADYYDKAMSKVEACNAANP